MSLSCVRCGAPFADGDTVCGACGLPRSASLPPGAVAPELLTPDPDPEPEPHPEPDREPDPEPDPEPSWDSPPVPEPEDPWGPPEPATDEPPAEDETVLDAEPVPEVVSFGTVAAEAPSADAPPRWTPPEEAFPAPTPTEPSELTFAPPVADQDADVYNYGPAEDDEREDRRSGMGFLDIFLALLGGAAAFAIMFVINDGDFTRVQDWRASRGCAAGNACGEINVHDLLVSIVEFSPFAIAAGTSLLSRVTGIGFVVAAVSQVPVFLFGNFHVGADWPRVFPVAVFLLTDLVLFLRGRGFSTGVLTGVLAGIGAVALPAVTFQRTGQLDRVTSNLQLSLQFLVVPGALVLLAGLLGGTLALLRRR